MLFEDTPVGPAVSHIVIQISACNGAGIMRDFAGLNGIQSGHCGGILGYNGMFWDILAPALRRTAARRLEPRLGAVSRGLDSLGPDEATRAAAVLLRPNRPSSASGMMAQGKEDQRRASAR